MSGLLQVHGRWYKARTRGANLRHGPESSDLNPRPLYLETMDFSCVKKFATIKSDIGFLRLVIWLVFQQEEGLAQANISGIGSNIS